MAYWIISRITGAAVAAHTGLAEIGRHLAEPARTATGRLTDDEPTGRGRVRFASRVRRRKSAAPTNFLELLPVDSILFETDFPRTTCLFENIQETITAGLRQVETGARRKILWGERGTALPDRTAGGTVAGNSRTRSDVTLAPDRRRPRRHRGFTGIGRTGHRSGLADVQL
ncbi:hypothetical protein [Pseudofrankia sp. BMG5.37]|uniref:hypothetical protein n=1 Tax=Pseudofrankia sp. BMG5.37 TaxID=3050035 RepID=UPI0028960728|nr:hypothetical protein [Pseudofrankia sp. BMG5.37]MDT3439865.1 hypothetical protein [Pseudofrankia sp. BMG5.37]